MPPPSVFIRRQIMSHLQGVRGMPLSRSRSTFGGVVEDGTSARTALTIQSSSSLIGLARAMICPGRAKATCQ